MSSENTPPPPDKNGDVLAAAPFKLAFGASKGLGLKKAPLVSNKKVSAFGHSEDKVEPTHRDELISGFDGNRIVSLTPKEEAKPLVIPKQENASWREQILAKRKKPTLVPGPGSLSAPMEIIEEPAQTVTHGLQLTKRVKLDHPVEDSDMEAAGSSTGTAEEPVVAEQKEETLDELAARKLIEAASGEKMESARKLVLSGQENVHAEDVEAFQKNLDELPDEASLDDYANVPVEEFGAALLRGMGWKGDAKGNDAIEYNRRPALLGLGAKPKEPEPITKKYIKPGESRTPQALKVPERNRTGRSDFPSLREDIRREDRDRDRDRDRGNRDHRDVRDIRDSRSTRDDKSSRDDGREGRSSRESRGDDRDSSRSGHRDGRDSKRRDDRDMDKDRNRDRDREKDRENRTSSDRRDDRHDDRRDDKHDDRHSSRSSREDRGSRQGHDTDRRRDRSRDSRDSHRRDRK